ncbi:MAG: HupE/UreJ family protein [Pseudomonadota bacterium]
MIKSVFNARALIIAAGLATLLVSPAFAHHPMGGAMPETLWHGLLSGLGHPVIGFDHLAFVIGVGIFSAIAGLGLAMPAFFLVFMGAGLFVHVGGFDIPAVELMIALSVVAVGLGCVLGQKGASAWLLGGLFAAAGLLHGYAFAEAIIGAETGVISAYIAGLVAVQFAIAAVAFFATRGVLAADVQPSRWAPRVAGAAVLMAGAYFAMGAVA